MAVVLSAVTGLERLALRLGQALAPVLGLAPGLAGPLEADLQIAEDDVAGDTKVESPGAGLRLLKVEAEDSSYVDAGDQIEVVEVLTCGLKSSPT